MDFIYPATDTPMTLADYHALPETNKICELVSGRLFMPPNPRDTHQRVMMEVFFQLSGIAPSGEVWQLLTGLHVDDENFYEPDTFWIAEENTICMVASDGYFHGAPDLVVEVITFESARHDKVIKFQVYEKHGVHEYWIVDPIEMHVEVWTHDSNLFVYQGEYSTSKTFASRVLGTDINVAKLLNG